MIFDLIADLSVVYICFTTINVYSNKNIVQNFTKVIIFPTEHSNNLTLYFFERQKIYYREVLYFCLLEDVHKIKYICLIAVVSYSL